MKDPRFRRSFLIVTAIHIALILGVLYFMKRPIKRMSESVTWMETGSFSSSGALETTQGAPSQAEEKKEEVSLQEHPATNVETSSFKPATTLSQVAPSSESENKVSQETSLSEPENKPLPEPSSEIKLPAPPLQALSKATVTPKEIPKVTPPPKATVASKPVSKPTPKPIPKPSPKPKPKPKPKSTEQESDESSEPVSKPLSKPSVKPQKKSISSSKKEEETSASTKKKTTEQNQHATHGEGHSGDAAKKAFLVSKQGPGVGSSSGGSGSGHGEGGGVDSAALGAYHELIHDRFYSQWDQPTSIPLEHKHDFVCTLRLTIERDGTISHFMLAKPSGNPIMDQSVMAAAAKVIKIAPLPQGLGANGAYTVNINFELE